MSRNFNVPWDPYTGLAVSVVTSEIIDGRDVFDLTLSHWTSAGTASPITIQVTNSGESIAGIAAASWSNWTTFTPSAATLVAPVLGFQWMRLLRTPSLASTHFAATKLVR